MQSLIKTYADEISFLMSGKLKSFYLGWHGHGNLGDEILYDAFVRLMGKHLAVYPKKYLGKGVRHLLNSRFDVLFLGGGTLINSDGFLKQLREIHAVKRVAFGTGVLDPAFWAGITGYCSDTKGWIHQLNGFDYLGVRGPLSLKHLKECGIKCDVKIIGDPAIIFAESGISRKRKNKVAGINIGWTRNVLWGGSDGKFLSGLIECLNRLGRNGWSFVFFPVCEKDLSFISVAMRELAEYPATCITNFNSIDSFLEKMKSVDLFIGEKLHSVILAACSYTPSIMLEYRPKCRDFMMSIGMEDCIIRTDQLSLEHFQTKVDQIYSSVDQYQDSLFHNISVLKKRLIVEAGKMLDICIK